MLSQVFYFIIDRDISSPGHGRKLVDGLKYIDKRSPFQLISYVQLPGLNRYDTHMVMHTGNCTSGVILASEFQKHLSPAVRKHGVIE